MADRDVLERPTIKGTGPRGSDRHLFFSSGMKTGHLHFSQVGISPSPKRRTLSQSMRSSVRATRGAGPFLGELEDLNPRPGIRIVVGGSRRRGQNGRTTLPPVDGSGNGAGPAGRLGDLTFRGLKPTAAQYLQLSPSQARKLGMNEAHFRLQNSR